MSTYDVIIIHPPAIYDFRKKTVFTGALGSSVEQIQFNKVPIGMLSIAEYLDRHGYRVMVDNIGDRMVSSPHFDAEQHLRHLSASVIAIGLNFQQHSQGAIEVARRCKELHPGSLIILGGLTATCFHEEIITKYHFVDAVIRAEAEKPFLMLLRALEKRGKLSDTPNLTYRTDGGELRITPLMPVSQDLDDFEYTRLDLIAPNTSIFPPGAPPRWSLAVCRGCIYNCSICGGSAYAYKKHMGMNKPAFRSPGKIVQDIRKLIEQGVSFIGLFQDPRMAGEKYWRELFAGLAREQEGIDRLSLDLLVPADEEFIREVAKIGQQVVLHICPDTGSDAVRRQLGRPYTNAELLNCIKLCHQYHLPVTTFFSAGLAGETADNIKETWQLWEELSAIDRQAQFSGSIKVPLGGPIVGPIVLDPGSMAFDNPEKYGYKLLYNNLEEYIAGLSRPSWHQWLNYETPQLDSAGLVDVIISTVEFAINQREKTGVYSFYEALAERLKADADRTIVREVDQIMMLESQEAQEESLRILKRRHEAFLNSRIG